MPYTSYTSYNYLNYGSNHRPYSGSKTYTAFSPSSPYVSSSSSSSYSLVPSATTSFVPSYKLGSSNFGATSATLPSSPYGTGSSSGSCLKLSTSSTSLSNYDPVGVTGFLRKKVSVAPSFLSGNTASLRKAFGDNNNSSSNKSDVTSFRISRTADTDAGLGYREGRRYNKVNEDKNRFEKTSYAIPSRNYNRLDTSSYHTKIGLFDPPKLKEIDSSKINYSSKPPRPVTGEKSDIKRNDSGKISRNRQAVRLTIKRNRLEKKDHNEITRNSVKTVAQKLLDKYTITELKKANNDSLHYGPRDRLYPATTATDNTNTCYDNAKQSLRNDDDRICNNEKEIFVSNSESEEAAKDNNNDDANTTENEKKSYGSKRRLSKPGAELEDGVIVFSRATRNAMQKEELESAQEIRDIIVAAAFHPDIDIESDEEIKQLIEADSGESLPDSPDISVNRTTKKSGRNINPVDSIAKPRKSIDLSLNDGSFIVDKLIRFVQKQVSIKKASVKRQSVNAKAEDINDSSILTVKIEGRRGSTNDNFVDTEKKQDTVDSSRLLNEKVESRKQSDNVLYPSDHMREQERYIKKSPVTQVALKKGMEKIKMSLAVCDNIIKNKEDNCESIDIEQTCNSRHSSDHSSSSSMTSCSPVIGSLTLGLQPEQDSTNTCLEDAPWRKKHTSHLNKSKTSVNVLNVLSSPNFSNQPLSSLAKSASDFRLDKSHSKDCSIESSTIDIQFSGESSLVHHECNKYNPNVAEIFDNLVFDRENKIIPIEALEKELPLSVYANLDNLNSCLNLTSNVDNITYSRNSAKLKEERTEKDDEEPNRTPQENVDEIFSKKVITGQSNLDGQSAAQYQKASSHISNTLPLSRSTSCKKLSGEHSSVIEFRSESSTKEHFCPAKEMLQDENGVSEAKNTNQDGTQVFSTSKNRNGITDIASSILSEEKTAKERDSAVENILNVHENSSKVDKQKHNTSIPYSIDNICDKSQEETNKYPNLRIKKEHDEILNARNVLKRPVVKDKQNTIDNSTADDTTKETAGKKVWKRPLPPPQNVAASSLQEIKLLKNVLKRPVKSLQSIPQNKINDSNKQNEPDKQNSAISKTKKLWKKPGIPRNNSSGNNSNLVDTDSEGEELSPGKRPQQKSPKRLSPKSSKANSCIAQVSPKKKLQINQRKSKEAFYSIDKKNCRITDTSPSQKANEYSTVIEATQAENLIGLCASKSADSAYGSSPSTPLPNAALQVATSTASKTSFGVTTIRKVSASSAAQEDKNSKSSGKEICKCEYMS